MNGKFEEKLLRLAYGETTPKESAAIERQAQADPEAARTLAEYRQMRTDLDLLSEIPPDQFSKERLRDAILGQGLKPLPMPTSSRWGWTWMPISAFAIAFGWLTIRHMNAPDPLILHADTGSVATRLTPPSESHNAELKPLKAVTPVALAHPHSKAAVETHLVDHRPILSTDQSAYRLADNVTNAARVVRKTFDVINAAKTIEAQPNQSDQNPATQPTPSGKLASINTPMVVINPENDNSSGAPKATEVDGANNVVVGG